MLVRVDPLATFSATNLTGLLFSVGDDAVSQNYYGPAVDVLTPVVYKTLPPTNMITPQADPTAHVIGAFNATYSSGNFSTHPVTGSLTVTVCWGMAPLTGQQ